MSDANPFVIVGASLAGAKAAETLREEGFDGRIVLIGAEDERPYERPPLSKEYLRGEADSRPYVHDESFYPDKEIELMSSRTVEAIDPGASTVSLDGGEALAFERLLLATGAEPRRVDLPGADLDGVLYLRSVADSDAIRERIEAGGKLVTIGAGWIGAEVAASAKQKGCEVTILEMSDVPLERVLGAELGAVFRDLHADHGTEFRGGARIEEITGDGSVDGVRLAGDERIEADFVVVGVGAAPRVHLAEAAGLAIGNGVSCDERLQTSAENVFAAGDVAEATHPLLGAPLRVEHWHNALEQGPAAARNMLAKDAPFDAIPYFFSDQYDLGMEYAGFGGDWAEVVIRGDLEGREFIAFWLDEGRVKAGMNVNVWDVTDHIQALIRSGAQVDRAALADPDTSLEGLAGDST
jgi:3-phenylpropionate/trans-cinnamate dioxygenase ferredoxin reductase subunit